MEAEYQRLKAKHFPHGTGKEALAAGMTKAQLDDALMKLRKEMPKSRIVIEGLPQRIKDALGISSDSLSFSADSLAKQLYFHSEITPKEYSSVIAKIADRSTEAYETSEKDRIALVVRDGRQYAVFLIPSCFQSAVCV